MFDFQHVKFKDVLDIPRLQIRGGTVTALMGCSGSGNSTVLRLLSKMISPTDGFILYQGTDLREHESIAYRRCVTLLSQSPVLFDGSLRDNLLIGHRFQQKPFPSDEELKDVLAQLRLDKSLDGPVNTLSGGEKQRLGLGRLLLLSPKVYLIDEPSAALEETTERDIIGLLKRRSRKENKTLIIATHSKMVAQEYADQIVEFSQGKVINGGEKA